MTDFSTTSFTSFNDHPLSLYIHWPFCQSKCPYCDFNSHVRAQIDEELWHQSLLQELKYVGTQTLGRPLVSVFFGGGTPSLMPAHTVAALIDELTLYWKLSPDLEITLEANPGSVEAQKFKSFQMAGINRVSLGIQSLHDDALKFLGRLHNSADALKAIDIAAKIFDRYSFDLIYARPQQSLDAWRWELNTALKLARHHISLYQLTIEPGTAFYTAHQRGDWQIPQEELSAEFYELTQRILQDHGMSAYEVSNYARAGHQCQHNMVYWRYQDYACIGPGAHGRLTLNEQKFSIQNYKAPETWLQAVKDHGHGQQHSFALTPRETLSECLMMGLRLTEGLPIDRLIQLAQPDFNAKVAQSSTSQIIKNDLSDLKAPDLQDQLFSIIPEKKITALVDEGYLHPPTTHLTLTLGGRQRLNAILKFLDI